MFSTPEEHGSLAAAYNRMLDQLADLEDLEALVLLEDLESR